MPVTLAITLEDTLKISISGPINDKMLCYGLLEAAKDAIRDHVTAAQAKIQPASPFDMAGILSASKKRD